MVNFALQVNGELTKLKLIKSSELPEVSDH